MAEVKKSTNFSSKDIILIVLIIVVIGYVVYLNMQISGLKESVGIDTDTEEEDGTVGSQLTTIQDNIDLVRANVQSCGIDQNCVNLFKEKGYDCPAGASPVCEQKFCLCQ